MNSKQESLLRDQCVAELKIKKGFCHKMNGDKNEEISWV